jgi:beta-RFAP synthase
LCPDLAAPMTCVRIKTSSRLHFGLLSWGPQAPRQFGGVGLMVEAPGIELVAEPAASWTFEGLHVERVHDLVHRVVDQPTNVWSQVQPSSAARIHVKSAPPEHVGLGVGTQLSLAVARAVLELNGSHNPSLETLARLSGRGRRSGIGLHGFLRGGLVVDGGRRDDVYLPPLVAQLPFPDDWSVLIVQPPGPRGRHGPDEVEAFSRLPPLLDRITERLCRLVLLGILPAVVERDLPAFGASVSELQHHVGAAFAPLQGGSYANSQSAAIIAELTQLGLAGAGQSSWGPTLYAFASLSEPDRTKISSRLCERFTLDPAELTWTRAANHGAVIDRGDL